VTINGNPVSRGIETEFMSRGLKVMLVDSRGEEERATIEGLLASEGFSVVGRYGDTDDLVAGVRDCEPDLVVVDAPAPTRRLLAAIRRVRETEARPIAMFCAQADSQAIIAAVGAGVDALFPLGDVRDSLDMAADLAVARFHETGRLLKERDDAATALSERKAIERAKGIIMKQRGLDEGEAYGFMRREAMNRNVRLGRLAATIIEAEELLR